MAGNITVGMPEEAQARYGTTIDKAADFVQGLIDDARTQLLLKTELKREGNLIYLQSLTM